MEKKEIVKFLKEILKGQEKLLKEHFVLKVFSEDTYSPETSVEEFLDRIVIVRDILTKNFSEGSDETTDWVYLLIEEQEQFHPTIRNIYCVGSTNCDTFDLNILLRKNFKYMYKISEFMGL